MQREIFEVYAKVVDANGAYNTLGGYPKVIDSKQHQNSIDKAMSKAYAEWHACLASMYTHDDRQEQIAMIIRVSDGLQIEMKKIGKLAQLPDPEPIVSGEA